MNKRRPPTAQYRRLISISQIAAIAESLLQSLDVPKALAQMKVTTVSDEETAESWAEKARQAARDLQALADKLAPENNGNKQDKPDKPDKPLRSFSEFKGLSISARGYAEGNSNTAAAIRLSKSLLKQEALFVQSTPTLRSVESIKQACPEISRLASECEISELATTGIRPATFANLVLRRVMPRSYKDQTLNRYGREKKSTYQSKK